MLFCSVLCSSGSSVIVTRDHRDKIIYWLCNGFIEHTVIAIKNSMSRDQVVRNKDSEFERSDLIELNCKNGVKSWW